MSEDRRSEERKEDRITEYNEKEIRPADEEEDTADEAAEAEENMQAGYRELLTDDELRKRIRERRKKAGRKRLRQKTRTVIMLIIVFALLLTMCGRDIVRLKAENIELKKQQAELKEERDRLEKELKDTKNKDYIQDQARKQLRLLNEGEILFLFGDDEYSSEKGKSEKTEE